MRDGLWSRRGVRRTAVAAALLSAVGLGAVGLHSTWAASPVAEKPPVVDSRPLAERTAALGDLENGFTAIADRLEPAVVSIRVEKKLQVAGLGQQGMDPGDLFRRFGLPGFGDDGQDAPDTPQTPRGNRRAPNMPRTFRMPQVMRGAGSGVIVRPDGWILTNDHVVGGVDKVTVTLHDGRQFPGTVRRDFRSDLALVHINATGLPTADFANSDNVRVGQWAVAFGSPFELDDTMTLGIVSARQRQKTISEDGETRYYPSLLQTDASINPGNSGGPLVDINGRIIGINVAINSTTGGSVGIGFAIPSNSAKEIMEQLITRGKVVRGFLGVNPVGLTPEQRATYGVPNGGALITQVEDSSPAGKAGVQVEDVIVRYNGQPVKDDIALRDLVARTAPGSKVELTVKRDGHDVTVPVTLGTAPEQPGEKTPDQVAPKPAQPAAAGKLGVSVEAITPDLAKQFKLSADAKGVVITQVAPGSPAESAGLEPGMAIVRVEGRAVTSADALRDALANVKSGQSVRLVLQLADATGVNSRMLVTVQMP